VCCCLCLREEADEWWVALVALLEKGRSGARGGEEGVFCVVEVMVVGSGGSVEREDLGGVGRMGSVCERGEERCGW
jgi:hypothetical protein